jgi:predicted transcriptional regulator
MMDSGVGRKSLRLDASPQDPEALEVLKALGSETRIAILRHVGERAVPVNEIAQALELPPSTAAMHIAILEKVGLLHTEVRPASRGLQKVCARTYDELVIDFPRQPHLAKTAIELSMPIGGYSGFEVEPTCGLAGPEALIGYLDDPNSFYEPDRLNAQLLWFRVGYVEYLFPNRVPPGARIDALQLTAEVCSEAPLYDPDWPSDISVWVNGVHLGEWTCPGDFGGTRGRVTPSWWDEHDSQFGLLKRWRVGDSETTIDGVGLSPVTVADLGLGTGEPIRVRIGVRRDAHNVGGINIFGRRFGNYPQDLGLRIEYDLARRRSSEPSGDGDATAGAGGEPDHERGRLAEPAEAGRGR